MKIDGIEIKNYRSFDSTGVRLEDFGKVNVFIGKNNSGKSNILNFITKLKVITKENPNKRNHFDQTDCHDYNPINTISFSLQYKKDSNLDILLKAIQTRFDKDDTLQSYISTKDSIWQTYSAGTDNPTAFTALLNDESWLSQLLPNDNSIVQSITSKLFNESYSERSAGLSKIHAIIPSCLPTIQEIYHVGVFRKIETNGTNFDINSSEYFQQIFNGINLVKAIRHLKHPATIDRVSRTRFRRIENFIRDILSNNDLTLNVAEANQELQLEDEKKGSPERIENLGTGIHQLIILAISISLCENSIICIEEPEIYLNPELQKKFINFLLQTNNQYFITTHSNSFINLDGIDIYHVTRDEMKSKVEKVVSSNTKYAILDDLGYHASDILQTNFLIWVEGPSDRIYLNHWIKSKHPDFIEGIHYTIMFYGGRLLSHLSAGSEEIDDFIRLNKINRNIAIVIDSDKNNASDTLRDTKTRIIDEFSREGYFYWVTAGREIENYLDKSVITSLANDFKELNIESDNNPFHKRTKTGDKSIDKIALAKRVIAETADYSVLDLNDRISDLVERIRKANNL